MQYVYDISRKSASDAIDTLIAGPSVTSLCGLLRKYQVLVQDDEWPVVKLSNDDNEEDWVEAAFCFYKQSKFNKSAGVRISVRGQPAVDTGGLRRHFFKFFSIKWPILLP